MDLTSLPEEMLANVLKYADYVTNTTLRKLNSHIENVSKAYEIGTRLPVTKLWFLRDYSPDTDGLFYWNCCMDIDSPILKFIKYPFERKEDENNADVTLVYKTNNQSHSTIINNIIPKIELRGTFKIFYFFDMDKPLLECLKENRKSVRGLTTLEIDSTSITCSPTSFREFIFSKRKLRSIEFDQRDGDMDVLFHAGACAKENVPQQYLSLGQVQCREDLFEQIEKRLIESTNGLNLEWTFKKYNERVFGAALVCKITFPNGSEIGFVLYDDIDFND